MSVDGRELYSEVLTQEPADEALLALHGLLGSHEYLRALAAQLEGDFQVTAFDLPGFGESPRPESTYTPDDHADAVASAVGSLALGESGLTVVGHSLGAVVGLRFAAEHPELVKHLVLVGMPMHETEKEGHETARQAAKVNWFMATQPGGRLVHQVLFEATPLARWYANRLDPRVGSDIGKHSFEAFAQSLQGVIRHAGGGRRDLETVLGAGVRTAVVYGKDDLWVNASSRERLDAMKEQGLQVATMPGDHHLPISHPEEIAKIVRA